MFLRFFEEHQGSTFFGEPVSDALIQEGMVVQYFQNARFEWRPNLPAGMQVRLTDLGYLALRLYQGQYTGMQSNLIDHRLETPSDLHVRAFVSQALVSANTPNTLYVVVQDASKNYHPIENALVSISVINSFGKQLFDFQVTSRDGVVQMTIPGYNLRPREPVQIIVTVEADQQTEQTSTWYRIWY